MKVLGIIGIIVAALGLWFSLAALGTTVANLDEMVGYGFIGLVFYGFFLALAIVSLKRK